MKGLFRELRAFNAAQRRLEEHIEALVLRGPVQALSVKETERMRQLLTPVLHPDLERQP